VPTESAARDLLEQAYHAALAAAAPEDILPGHLRAFERHDPAVVLGAGKAAAAMAAAFHASWDAPVSGFVVTRYGHGLRAGESSGDIEIIEAGHPSPDSASLSAGARLLETASALGADDRLFFLISGGGSALAAAPLAGITFEQKRAAADFLISAGADIREINCVRKHLSGLKGGRLAKAAHPARVVTFAISDVPGDAVGDIASGPTIPDSTTQAQAIGVLESYRYPGLEALRSYLEDPTLESPKPSDPAFGADQVHLIASASTALTSAATLLERSGYKVLSLGDDLDDEATTLGHAHGRLALEQVGRNAPVAILSGGETRVVLGGGSGGCGGRNLEYLAGLALELDGAPGIYALAADTDGIDGRGGHAGGFVVPELLALGAKQGLSLAEQLARHDTHAFFAACGLLLETGPTRTNVNDFRLILCHPSISSTRR
jgi:glycerate 2-kinase